MMLGQPTLAFDLAYSDIAQPLLGKPAQYSIKSHKD